VSLSKIRRIKDPRRRAAAAAEYLHEREQVAKTEIATIRDVRDKAARDMLAARDGDRWAYRPADVARTLGITRASVSERFGKRKG
jgi:hypothetical protein